MEEEEEKKGLSDNLFLPPSLPPPPPPPEAINEMTIGIAKERGGVRMSRVAEDGAF